MAEPGNPEARSQSRAVSEPREVGLGCMRLSTVRERDDEHSLSVLHAALDAGVTLLDTADAYCLGQDDTGHNERLIARALATWAGDRSRVRVATKGGLRRPAGRWQPDGRGKHLVAACEASLVALGVERIDLYQLHVPDPRTPLATSVRALARLQKAGKVRDVGLCNVNVSQIEEARAIVEIHSVQVELSALRHDPLKNGVAEYCREHGIRLLAHSPLGGPRGVGRLARSPALAEAAARLGVEPAELALAWLCDLDRCVVPLPGATRVETARAAARAQRIELDAADRQELELRLPAGRLLRTPRARRRPPDDAAGEVVLVMGYPAAGKSGVARELVERGYSRLNRDRSGGSLARLARELDRVLADTAAPCVLDNTYATRASRSDVIETAWLHGRPVRCVWMQTSLEDAQVNAVQRMLRRHGRLLSPDEMRELARREPSSFPPRAQFDYRRLLEAPTPDEGFSNVEVRSFARTRNKDHEQRALLLEYEGVLRRSRSGARTPEDADDVEVLPGRAAVLRGYSERGFRLLGISWQPELADGSANADEVARCFDRTHELLGVEIEVAWCPHAAGPPVCWCRKPLPGLGVAFIEAHRLDPARSIHVGVNAADRSFAERIGMQFLSAGEVFGGSC